MSIQILVISGVSGSGKTTVGSLLAQDLDWVFVDADDFHTPENIEKMRQGIPLTDADRQSWLLHLGDLIQTQIQENRPTVLACSALKEHYRQLLRRGVSHKDPETMGWVYLYGSPEQIEARLRQRQHPFMNPSLLASQLAALEAPQDPATLQLEISATPQALAQHIRQHYRL
ncbi:gluconokinase [Synechococcus sp. Nb3U1]|uniref:gluconokinase n=1 Tax=Synechococcus sp. Nb3U1 TaxID=1914529 RepID=UPI001F2400FE|nr:gluconokinase [Synechococcus sp. Nb3U1]MCF2969942.1 gluconokinase [Synechococcus sp. Nb3U1]